MQSIIKGVLEGKRNAIAKALSIIENDPLERKILIKGIIERTGYARTIGITGAAGAGKSTLIDKIIKEYRDRDYKIGVLAIDPTSSISGGAILGDRVRMQEHALDNNIFIRSMASRGARGGISRSLIDAIRVLDAAGFNRIIVESVGAGQLDIEIIDRVDVTLVIFNPQTGDSVQAIKAGLTEVGDIYVVNKADLDGAEKLYHDIKDLIIDNDRSRLLYKTIALTGEGIKELVNGIEDVITRKNMNYNELLRERVKTELLEIIDYIINSRIKDMLKNNRYDRYIEMILTKKIDPYIAAEEIVNTILR